MSSLLIYHTLHHSQEGIFFVECGDVSMEARFLTFHWSHVVSLKQCTQGTVERPFCCWEIFEACWKSNLISQNLKSVYFSASPISDHTFLHLFV